MRDQDQRSLRIPLDWVIVDALGAMLAGAGAYGLLAGPGGALSILAKPGVAWLCIAFGVGLMALALAKILGRIVQQSAQRADARAPRGRN
jgi:amino acid transporter